jgi:hypothetical protein
MTPLARALADLDAAATALTQEVANATTVMGQALDTMRALARQCREGAEQAEAFAASLDTGRFTAPRKWAFQVRCLDPGCASAGPVKTMDREIAESIASSHAAKCRHTSVVESLTREADRSIPDTFGEEPTP